MILSETALAKTERFDRQRAALQSRENDRYKLCQDGTYSERILLILLKNICISELDVSNSRNSGATEILVAV